MEIFGIVCSINSGDQYFKLVHRDILLFDMRKIFERIYRQFLIHYKNLVHVIEKIGYQIIPNGMRKSSFAKKSNNLMKKSIITINDNQWLIGADTHYAELDLVMHYANSGCILYGYASYLLIENGLISLFEEKY